MIKLSITTKEVFQSTPLLRGATIVFLKHLATKMVSIHAPLARGDEFTGRVKLKDRQFQSTPLLRGATGSTGSSVKKKWFQSTPLLRGATNMACFL